MKHINLTISGRVQGVGFRNAAKHQSRFLGIKGYVKNKSDGTVYIEAEGDQQALTELVKWCKKGPAFATVDEVIVEEAEVKYFDSFDARD
jgi:acylphosphatase